MAKPQEKYLVSGMSTVLIISFEGAFAVFQIKRANVIHNKILKMFLLFCVR